MTADPLWSPPHGDAIGSLELELYRRWERCALLATRLASLREAPNRIAQRHVVTLETVLRSEWARCERLVESIAVLRASGRVGKLSTPTRKVA